MSRRYFDRDDERSVRIMDRPKAETQPDLVDRLRFDEPMMCNRCYGKHVGFTCPNY